MKVTGIRPYTAEIIEAEEEDDVLTYNRVNKDSYCILTGEAWELVSSPRKIEKIEAAYQEYKKRNPV